MTKWTEITVLEELGCKQKEGNSDSWKRNVFEYGREF